MIKENNILKKDGKKIIVIFLSILFFSLSLFSLTEYDARYLKLEKTYTLNADGSWIMDYTSKVKINSYTAMRRMFGESFIRYNPKYQELSIVKSVTTMKDGKKVPTPDNGYNEILPYDVHRMPDFAHIREMVVSHTGLELGAVVDFKYRIVTNSGFMPYFSVREHISQIIPVENLTLKFIVPESKNLKFKVLNIEKQPIVKKSAGKKEYIFQFKDLIPYHREPYNNNNDIPFIIATNASSWRNIIPDFNELKLSVNLSNKVSEIKEKSSNKLDFVMKVQDFVSSDIQTTHISTEVTGFNIRKPGELYTTKYGTPLEKAALMYSIFKKYEIPVEIIGYFSGVNFEKTVPTIYLFDKIMLNVSFDERELYLDPVEKQKDFQNYKFAGATLYNLTKNSENKINKINPEDNRIYVSGKVNIDDKISGELNISANGCFYDYKTGIENEKKLLKNILKKIFLKTDVEVEKVFIKSFDEIQAKVKIKGEWLKEKDKFRFLEFFNIPAINSEMVKLDKRKFPIYVKAPFKVNIDLDMKVNDKYNIEYTGENKSMKNTTGMFGLKTENKNNRIKVMSELQINKRRITDYNNFKDIVRSALSNKYLLILKEVDNK